jgi:ATP-dependent DNA helicase RecQ
LRRWRLETAQTQGVPPYVILHDATLAALATAKPADFPALGRVQGIGEAKLARYGLDILNLINA